VIGADVIFAILFIVFLHFIEDVIICIRLQEYTHAPAGQLVHSSIRQVQGYRIAGREHFDGAERPGFKWPVQRQRGELLAEVCPYARRNNSIQIFYPSTLTHLNNPFNVASV
jgi:hypothetical protein